MGLIRLLAYILLFSIAWFLIKNYLAKQQRSSASRAKKSDTSKRIVCCSFCDLHLPEDTAVSHGSDWFCSNEHKQAFLEES